MNPDTSITPTAPSISTTAMQNAIDYAKQDPNSSYAQELQKRIQSGQYNDVLKQMGKDTSKYAQPVAPAPIAAPAPTIAQKVGSAIKETASNYEKEVAPAAADVMGEGNIGDAASKLSQLSDTGAPISTDEGKNQAHLTGGAIEDATLGTASDAVRALFAPITAPIHTLIAHSVAQNSGKTVAGEEGNDSPQAVAAREAIANWAKTHPQIAKTVGDAINVGGSTVGSGALDASVGDLATSAKGAIENGVKKGTDTLAAAKDAALGTPEQQATAKATADAAAASANKEGVTSLLKQDPETMTSKMKKDAVDEGRQIQTDTKLGGNEVDYLPTKEVKRAGEVMSDPTQVPDPIKPGDKTNVVVSKVQNAIKVKGADAEKFLEDNPVKLTNKEDLDMFTTMRDSASEVSDKTQMGAYDGQLELFQKQLQKQVAQNGGGYTTANYYKALKGYEDNVASQFKGGKEMLVDPTGVGSAKVRAAADIRTTIRDMIGAKHPEFQPQMYDLASLYEAKDNAIFNASKTTSKSILDKYPKATKVAKIGIELTGLGLLGRAAGAAF